MESRFQEFAAEALAFIIVCKMKRIMINPLFEPEVINEITSYTIITPEYSLITAAREGQSAAVQYLLELEQKSEEQIMDDELPDILPVLIRQDGRENEIQLAIQAARAGGHEDIVQTLEQFFNTSH